VQAGGGALADHSVHVTDALRYVLGAEVESVSAETGTLLHPELAVDDCAILLLKFSTGAVASVDPSWSIPANHPYHYDFYLRILGADGLITIDDTRQALAVVRDGVTTGRGAVLEQFGVDVDAEMVQHFIRSVRAGALLPPGASGEDGLRALEISLAAYSAAESGQVVHLAQLSA
jgi:predicted dehydrogenase